MSSPDYRPLARLPIQVRPIAGERARSFIVRLAAANHLKADHLRSFLCEPPLHRGHPSWSRLAAVTGRDPDALREILDRTHCAQCGNPTLGISHKQTCSQACRQKAYRRRHPKPNRQQTVACQFCGRKLIITVHGETRRWCSAGCRQKGYRQRQRERAEALAAQPTCDECGTPLGPGSRRRWCSKVCSHRAYIRRRIERGESPLPTPDPKAPPREQPTICAYCSGPLLPGRKNQIRLTCSATCRTYLYHRRKKERLTQEHLTHEP
ncbi:MULTISPECIES: TniQ family protein [unclassified Streptomyces]|uniref:TniQ family protein n=1 Tax=unclassified Streptomyces TaxID=2593676 RepID=UPI000DB36546|nr:MULTISPECIES: TniQ family protein [unclassified Streptomyces]PZT77302.1 hypothetical protein DNK56_29290 [Streptomyces sp. AC1-42W]